MKEFKNKVAAITGSATGIGRAFAEEAAKRGMRLALIDINTEGLEETKAICEKAGAPKVVTIKTDVTKYEEVRFSILRVMQEYGQLDLMFANAGIATAGWVYNHPPQDWAWAMNTNVLGLTYYVHEVLPIFKQQGTPCHFLFTASIAGLITGLRYNTAYLASKHAAVCIAEAVRDLAENDPDYSMMGVSVFCPEYVHTNIHNSEDHRPADYSVPCDPFYATDSYWDYRRLFDSNITVKGMNPPSSARTCSRLSRRTTCTRCRICTPTSRSAHATDASSPTSSARRSCTRNTPRCRNTDPIPFFSQHPKSPAGFPAGLSRFLSCFYPCSQLLQHEGKRLPEREPATHGELHIRRAVHRDGVERLRRQIREDARPVLCVERCDHGVFARLAHLPEPHRHGRIRRDDEPRRSGRKHMLADLLCRTADLTRGKVGRTGRERGRHSAARLAEDHEGLADEHKKHGQQHGQQHAQHRAERAQAALAAAHFPRQSTCDPVRTGILRRSSSGRQVAPQLRILRPAGRAGVHVRLERRTAVGAAAAVQIERQQIRRHAAGNRVHVDPSIRSMILFLARKYVTFAHDSDLPKMSAMSRKLSSPSVRSKNTSLYCAPSSCT